VCVDELSTYGEPQVKAQKKNTALIQGLSRGLQAGMQAQHLSARDVLMESMVDSSHSILPPTLPGIVLPGMSLSRLEPELPDPVITTTSSALQRRINAPLSASKKRQLLSEQTYPLKRADMRIGDMKVADMQATETRAEFPVPSTAALPTRTPENPFTLNSRREELLKLFLGTTKPCWNAPLLPFRAKGSTEDLQHYMDERKAYHNRVAPKIANIMHLFIPSIMRKSDTGSSLLLASLAPTHLNTLNKLYQWYKASGWRGVMALYPWTFLECTRYDFTFNFEEGTIIHPSASIIEAHRRVLELERVCSDLTDYLRKSFTKTEAIRMFPQQHLKLALAAITAGAGLYGTGKDFWSPAPSNNQAVERLIQALGNTDVSSSMADDCIWLHGNRDLAFTRTYTVMTELDWGLPLLALFFKHQGNLAHLDEEQKAQGMLQVFEDDMRERIGLYIMDLEPLLLYGGRLTRYTQSLYDLCKTHFATTAKIPGTKCKLTFPGNCKILSVNTEGKLIGPDGQPTNTGHFSLPEATLADGDSRPPLPFPLSCCDISPNEQLKELADARIAKEERLLREMLTTVHGSTDEPRTVAVMRRGLQNALRRFKDDSHQARLTCIFPPTASMPTASYMQEQLFKI
jgi:hypothetical protein